MMTSCPTDLVPLVDADILRYEVGFAAETGWRSITEDENALPPFHYVEEMLEQRLEVISLNVRTTKKPRLFLTEGPTFREQIATRAPYKGTRKDKKPWHFNNISVYLRAVHDAETTSGLEADDVMSVIHTQDRNTIVCSRDKDLRQVPGYFYSWELGRQPSFGPTDINQAGWLALEDNKLSGTGLAFFYAQVLMGDSTDNIPGIRGLGPKKVAAMLGDLEPEDMYEIVQEQYKQAFPDDWEEALLEQGRLCWMTRRLHPDGSPVLWELGMVS